MILIQMLSDASIGDWSNPNIVCWRYMSCMCMMKEYAIDNGLYATNSDFLNIALYSIIPPANVNCSRSSAYIILFNLSYVLVLFNM